MTQQLTCSINDACRMTGLGRTTVYAMLASGQLQAVKIGRRRLVKTESIRSLVDQAA